MTPYKLIILFFLQPFFVTTQGQTTSNQVDSLVKSYISQLRERGIDTVCIYQDYCVGCEYSAAKDENICDFPGWIFLPTYIFWIDKGLSFMTKKDNCFDYSTIKIDNPKFWKLYFSNKDAIKQEQIKVPQFIEIKNGEKNIYSSIIDHSTRQNIKIITKNEVISKSLDDYSFSEKIGLSLKSNINYKYNSKTYLKKLQLLLDKTVEDQTKNLIKTRR
ncbi:hypothetical protein GCM10027043_52860 [Ferruginibacter profundus]